MHKRFRDVFDSIKTPALQTALISSLLVYCVGFYLTSRGNIWAISAGFALLGSVWNFCLERAMLEITSDSTCAGFVLPNVLLCHSASCLSQSHCCPDDPSDAGLHIQSL